MLPDIGLIVCAYAIYRIFEILLIGRTRYATKGAYVVSLVCGIIAIVVIAFVGIDLVMSGTRATLQSQP